MTAVIYQSLGIHAVIAQTMLVIYVVSAAVSLVVKLAVRDDTTKCVRVVNYVRDKIMLRSIMFYFIALSINFDLYSIINIVNVDSAFKHTAFSLSSLAAVKILIGSLVVMVLAGWKVHEMHSK
jgi:hypothetical protein